MTAQTVITEIKSKFGSITRFAKITKQDRYELQKLFARKNPDPELLQKQINLVQSRKVKSTEGEISPELISKLEKKIKAYGGVIKFTRENDNFSKDSIFQILSGRRKRITAKVTELLNYFNLIDDEQ